MKYLKIQNNGVLDIRLVALMGGTTKAGDQYKIGQFGTGLKYTLAFLLRNNLSFHIFCGDQAVSVTSKTEHIQGTDFDVIYINNERTSITTQMGSEWSAWMIVRELWCNALDEGGAEYDVTTEVQPAAGKTVFYIQADAAISTVIRNWNRYFLHDIEPLYSDKDVAIYPPGPHLCIYKQGVLIKEMPNVKGVFSYDYKRAPINELREYNGTLSLAITNCLVKANERAISHFLQNVTEDHYEGEVNFDYNWFSSFGETWKKVIGSTKLIYPEALKELQARDNQLDLSKYCIVPKCLYKALTAQFEGIGALTIAGKAGDFYPHPDPEVDLQVKKASVILESTGYTFHPKIKFVAGYFDDKSVIAQVDVQSGTVFLSHQLTKKSLFDVITTLIEENEHLMTGLQDKTYAFQQHFINLYARALLATNSIEI